MQVPPQEKLPVQHPPDQPACAQAPSLEQHLQGPASASCAGSTEGPLTRLFFGQLTSLYAASCRLSSWRDVDELNKLPQLQELRVSGNPLLVQCRTGGRFEVRELLCPLLLIALKGGTVGLIGGWSS